MQCFDACGLLARERIDDDSIHQSRIFLSTFRPFSVEPCTQKTEDVNCLAGRVFYYCQRPLIAPKVISNRSGRVKFLQACVFRRSNPFVLLTFAKPPVVC